MDDKVALYQIYYHEKQKKDLFPWAIPYFNEGLTEFFENTIIADLVSGVDSEEIDKIAVCSHTLKQKMLMRIPPRRNLEPEVLKEDFDVMSFTKNTSDHTMMKALETWHPGSTDILRLIFGELSLAMPREPKYPIYQNGFCARTLLYKQYVKEFLKPAMEVMSGVERIKVLCWQNSNYTRTTLNQPVDYDRIEKFLGVRLYPMHPFLLERCFSLWIDRMHLKVVYL